MYTLASCPSLCLVNPPTFTHDTYARAWPPLAPLGSLGTTGHACHLAHWHVLGHAGLTFSLIRSRNFKYKDLLIAEMTRDSQRDAPGGVWQCDWGNLGT